MTKRLLFLCTGNYYRSRYAELLFNALADEAGLDWRAESRGLRLTPGRNPGPISAFVVERCAGRELALPDDARMPIQADVLDLFEADLVVALKEAEHRPLLAARFGAWARRVEYWHVHDIDRATPDEALPELEALVERLVERLARQRDARRSA